MDVREDLPSAEVILLKAWWSENDRGAKMVRFAIWKLQQEAGRP